VARRWGIPALLDIAKNSKDPKIRKQSIFWLGQSGDPRAISYFESVLVKNIEGRGETTTQCRMQRRNARFGRRSER